MKREIIAKAPDWATYPDKGCELYPTCLGNDEYPYCPFIVCIEDLKDQAGEQYNREQVKALRKWFLRRVK